MRKYRAYSEYLIDKYGEKTYKIPLNLKTSCPNRDENGQGGCIFCAEVGTGFESLSNELSVKEQLNKNISYISQKYNANKFIAYLQNYTNTYMPLEDFKKIIYEIIEVENIVEISVSTRPDCLTKEYLDFLKIIELKYGLNISIELGLQTINNRSLKKLKRGHGVAAFIAAVNLIKHYKYEICVHLIPNLPWDNIEDVIEAAYLMNALEIDAVKLHSLYVAKNTELAELYLSKEIRICNKYQYIDRVIAFLEHLNEDVVIQRFFARAPANDTIFCNWKTSWWKLKEMLDEELEKRETYQGRLYEDLTTTGLKKYKELEVYMSKKLLIWDIDGTLIRCQGVGRIAMTKAFKEMYNIDDALGDISLSGTVDNEIFKLIYDNHNLSMDTLEELKESYGKILRFELMMVNGITVHKGVRKLLEFVSNDNDYISMIGTGNCKIGSDEKLKALGLYDYFDLGSYGDEVDSRNQLIENAIMKAEDYYNHKFIKSNIYVIGDTPGDIKSARHNNVNVISVSTGFHQKEELLEYSPDFLMNDLTDIDEFIGYLKIY